MMMPGREYQAQPSRFGFNGKENDNDVKGFGNQQDYGMRIYDTRLGKFLSVDPITRSFPMLTPYQFSENQPIWAIDLDGLEKYVVTKYYNKDKQNEEITITVLKDKDAKEIINQDLHHNGVKKWKKNVLVRNVYANGTTTYEHLPTLDKEQEKIYKTAKLEINKEMLNPFGVEYGGKNGDGGQTLGSVREDFTDDKFQIETRRSKFSIVDKRITLQGLDNNHNDPDDMGNKVISAINDFVNDFKSTNPKATDIKTSIVFTTIGSNKSFVQKIADRLEALGVKTKIVTDEKYRSNPRSSEDLSTPKDFLFVTNVSGVIK